MNYLVDFIFESIILVQYFFQREEDEHWSIHTFILFGDAIKLKLLRIAFEPVLLDTLKQNIDLFLKLRELCLNLTFL